ncbi:hypothetical protein M8C21_000652, partial [Ambrosia artemisiifolia]
MDYGYEAHNATATTTQSPVPDRDHLNQKVVEIRRWLRADVVVVVARWFCSFEKTQVEACVMGQVRTLVSAIRERKRAEVQMFVPNLSRHEV